jgi:hypothetical protein
MSAWSFPGGGIESTEEKKTGIEYTEDQRKQSVDICIYHLRGKCRYGDRCYGQHKDCMYQIVRFVMGGIDNNHCLTFLFLNAIIHFS